MGKTTLHLDGSDYWRLKRLAAERRVPPARLVREAIAQYVATHDTTRLARNVGAFRSGRSDLSESAEDLLAGFGRTR